MEKIYSATIVLISVILFITWGNFCNLRKKTIKGSLARYKWSTAEKTLRYPASIIIGVCILKFTQNFNGWGVFWIFMTLWYSIIYYIDYQKMKKLDSEDDDSWYKKMKSKIKSYLKSFSLKLKTSNASI